MDSSPRSPRQAPGGSTSIDLSHGSKPSPNTKKVWNRRKQEWVEVSVDPEENQTQEEEKEEEEEQGKGSPEKESVQLSSAPVSSNSYASGVSQNTGNFITDKPTTKVRAPPGGASSISFG